MIPLGAQAAAVMFCFVGPPLIVIVINLIWAGLIVARERIKGSNASVGEL